MAGNLINYGINDLMYGVADSYTYCIVVFAFSYHLLHSTRSEVDFRVIQIFLYIHTYISNLIYKVSGHRCRSQYPLTRHKFFPHHNKMAAIFGIKAVCPVTLEPTMFSVNHGVLYYSIYKLNFIAISQ